MRGPIGESPLPDQQGPLSPRRALNHVHAVLLCLYPEPCVLWTNSRGIAQLVSAENKCTTSFVEIKWPAWLFCPPGHLRHSHCGTPCWPANIKRGWWRSVGIWWRQPARRSCQSKWAWVKEQNSTHGTNYTLCFVFNKTQIHPKYEKSNVSTVLREKCVWKCCSVLEQNHSASYWDSNLCALPCICACVHRGNVNHMLALWHTRTYTKLLKTFVVC